MSLIEEKQTVLRIKLQEFTTPATSRVRKSNLEEEINSLKNEIIKLKEWSTALEIKPSQDLRRKAIEKASINFKVKFRLKDDCIAFWEQFREYLVQHYSKSEISHVLLPLLRNAIDIPHAGQWFSKLELIPNLSIESLKQLFINEWSDPIWRGTRSIKIHSYAYGLEQGIEFANRISALFSSLDVDLSNNVLKQEFYERLPPSLKLFLQSPVNDFNSITDIIEKIKQFPDIPQNLKLSPKFCDYCSKEVQWTCSCYTCNVLNSKKRKTNNPTKDICRIHPHGTHSSAECKAVKIQKTVTQPVTDEKKMFQMQ